MTQVVKPAHNLANMDASMSAAAPSLAPNSNNNGYLNGNSNNTNQHNGKTNTTSNDFKPASHEQKQKPSVQEVGTAQYVSGWVHAMLFWEQPVRSAALFASLMTVLILTQYYSLLQLAAAGFTILTALNWCHVNAQKFVLGSHPHTDRFVQGISIPRDRVERAAQRSVDVLEAIVQQITRLMLIEDSARSAWAAGIAYLVWTLGAYIPTKYMVGVFIVGAFTLPRLYTQNKEVIDRHVAEQAKRAQQLTKQYGSVAMVKAKELYGQAMTSINKSKAPVTTPVPTTTST
ncbi:hypothetical protein RO3G_08778 [Lichtheimia corymbifera JMRC:FSU:9682]|uniref:Reticulon-like protein n=1 Tax=Lichtheimia corymbifera JMRC:FSU:9682 TaxID=1263082 RepID=A0A068RR74_9FUNG|nr:hypothetical protein RO3G_08778 [Lichtheimia corymbifera JMRC:FSU:9682]